MPVAVEDGEFGLDDEPQLYIKSVYRGWLSGALHASRDGKSHLNALLITRFSHDDANDITPEQPPSVIDAEVIQPELPGGAA